MRIKFVLSGLLVVLVCKGYCQTLFTYGKNTVAKAEFVRAFNKNPNAVPDRKKALREYLNLYIHFKLKVQAAYDAGLGNDATQHYELDNFKKQIAENVINEQAKVKDLLQEASRRSLKDVHLAQVFIEVLPIGDTLEAFRKIQAAYKSLKEGTEFQKVAEEFSTEAYTKQSGGDLGYITVFTLPYEFENVAYALKPGTISSPFRSKLGYHIFKNLGERSGLGRRRVSQILITFPPQSSEAEKAAARRKADSIYNLLKSGTSFEQLVAAASNDVSTVNNGGQLAEFGIGQYNSVFEQAAFSLTAPGEISRPFETNYGFHILKLMEIKPVDGDVTTNGMNLGLKEKIMQEDRLLQSKKLLVNKQLELIKYKPALYNEKELWQYTDSSLNNKRTESLNINAKTLLFSYKKQNISAGDWVKFVKAMKSSPNNEFGKKEYPALMKDYVNITASEYYRNHLEDYSIEYKQQVDEFREANLLFGIMDKNVWSKANTDTAGLQSYYNVHKDKYQWSASADALIITCNNARLVTEVQDKLRQGFGNWRAITAGYENQVVSDSGRYELSQLPVVDRTNFQDGITTAPVKNPNDSSFTFSYIIKVYNQPAQRSFNDARGMIISDYQQVLEERWLAELKRKYPVKVNQAVFNTVK